VLIHCSTFLYDEDASRDHRLQLKLVQFTLTPSEAEERCVGIILVLTLFHRSPVRLYAGKHAGINIDFFCAASLQHSLFSEYTACSANQNSDSLINESSSIVTAADTSRPNVNPPRPL